MDSIRDIDPAEAANGPKPPEARRDEPADEEEPTKSEDEVQIAQPGPEPSAAPPQAGAASTNLGAFREYATAYLRAHPETRDDLILLVRVLDPTAKGLPL